MNATHGFLRMAAVLLAVGLLAPAAVADDEADLQAAFERAEKLVAEAKYKEAVGNFEKALALALKVYGKDHENTAVILNNLAALYLVMGQLAKSEAFFQRSLLIIEARFGKDHPDTAHGLNNLGMINNNLGQYAKAEPLLLRALAIREAKLGKDHAQTADTLVRLADLYRNLGQYAKAEALYLRALPIHEKQLGKDHRSTIDTTVNLGMLYWFMGQHARAEPLLESALGRMEATKGKDHPETAEVLNNLALIYRDLGKHARAASLYQRSLDTLTKEFGKDFFELAAALNNLALVHCDLGYEVKDGGHYAEAQQLLERALAIDEAQVGKDHPSTALALENLARLHAANAQWDKALLYQDQLRRQVRGYVSTVLPILTQKEQDQFVKVRDESQMHFALSLGLFRRDHAADRARGATWLLNGKAVAGQVQAEGLLRALESLDPKAAELSRQLVEARRALAALTLQPPGGTEAAARTRKMADLSAEAQGLVRSLSQATGRPIKAEWIELADVRKALPRDGVLVEVARFDRIDLAMSLRKGNGLGGRYAAWIIPPVGDVAVVDLGDAGPIDEAIKTARTELEAAAKTIAAKGERQAEKQLQKRLVGLAGLVLHPLLPHIGKAKTWIVSPDSNLWLVPWAALPLPDGGYAIESHALQYVVSGRDLLTPKNDRVKPTAPLVLADPDFNRGLVNVPEANPGLQRGLSRDFKLGNVLRLPGTAIEAEAILPHLETFTREKANVFTDHLATTATFKAAKNPRVVVVSTHGFFLEVEKIERPDTGDRGAFSGLPKPTGLESENVFLRCGLLLAGCNSAARAQPGQDTGVLTGLEIVGTDLRGTEMVVLSACETGLGDVRNGEGVAGLRQAFQLAGAESVVSTLWQVPDLQSAQLIVAFFDKLADKQSRDAALAGAQREMIGKRRDRFGAAHPYFWAAYTLTGQAK